ncbi:di-heme oxidoredictase family protein [Bdellovibrio sp. 22V]|uniref:di-heme oxidoredictase family protein n=1 Tax=Bdellovibrio sp. 22V TaxID=3044166 RepID=UPI0025439364|nr:di-heme oxidoredictase family protein [Bdellovibrio sp. 22V]WII70707.1 di-heme oxidoredictase family protein [Bdellovibrio sp. 22V]
MKAWIAILSLKLIMVEVALAAPQINMDYVRAIKTGGDTTVFFKGESVQAFRNPAANLSEDDIRRHLSGDALFERNFSDDTNRFEYGLGPVFNNTSCNACHSKDGRGALPVIPFNQEWVQLKQNEAVFLRISIEDGIQRPKNAQNKWGAPVPVPGFSDQLFHLGSMGVREDIPGSGQAQVWMKYEKSTFTYPDGEVVNLRKPLFKVTGAYDEYFDSVTGQTRSRLYENDVKMGARIGTPMIGLGLLEAIKESDILALAARDLSDEGVSGKPNYVIDIEKVLANNPYPVSMGRFGLKNNTPSVMHQSLGALRGDIGVTNYAFPDESIVGTILYDIFKNGRTLPMGVEAPREVADDIVFYSQTLAVPSRRNVDEAEVVRGAELFHQVSCTSCHQPSYVTGPHQIAAFSNQKIYPYTDMLLHDMGDGLADGRQDFDATGREWKTRPLWGIGQTQTINPRAGFLHDGRARTIEEAILWHGGEGEYSKNKFTRLPKADRTALIHFIKSL